MPQIDTTMKTKAKRFLTGTLLLVAVAAVPGEGGAQSVATRTPNILGGWTAPRGVVQLNFLHRFSMTDAPLRKIINTPTFNVGTGITDQVMVGFIYGTNSSLVPAYPNEWEFYARALPLAESRGNPFDLSVQGGYNVASESIDGELLLARNLGRLRLLAAGRAFSEGYGDTEARFAVAAGAVFGLTDRISLAGDYGTLLDRGDDEDTTWGVGLQMGVPYTPHSFSIQVGNVGTASLEGTSRGGDTRWGFEYTIPITIRRYLPQPSSGDEEEDAMEDRSRPPSKESEPPFLSTDGRVHGPMMSLPAATDSAVVEIQNLDYSTKELEVDPGTVVVWVNQDPVQHSITADDGSFDSGLFDPDQSFAMTFDEPGTYTYHCTPHPFMRGRVVVREPMEELS